MEPNPSFDAIVIGGSSAGISAAMRLARARRSVLVVDAGFPRNRYAREAHGFLGQDGKPPAEILADARRQLLAYPSVQWRTGDAVQARGERDRFEVDLGDGSTVKAARLVLATGVVDVLPELDGLLPRWGHSVLHCPYCHAYEVADRPLGVMATSPMSQHQALLIPDWGPVTYFTHGGFAPDAEERARLAQRNVTLEDAEVVELLGDAPGLDGVRLGDGRTIVLQALFVAVPTRPASALAEQLGCAYDEARCGPVIRVDRSNETTVPGVYAGGDAAQASHSIAQAVADGAIAGISAHQSLAIPWE